MGKRLANKIKICNYISDITWDKNNMTKDRKWYKWFYDNIHSHYYNLLIKWCFLPFGGERKFRKEMLSSIDILPQDKILDMGCRTGGVTFTIAQKVKKENEIIR